MANKVRQKQMQQQRTRQARAARQRQLIYIGVGVVVVLLVIGFAATRLMAQPATANASANTASAATCSDIQSPPDEGRAHLVPGQTPTYQGNNPPSSGTHNPNPLPAGIYDSPVDVTMEVHSQEHGYIVIHYNGISQGEIEQLKQIVSGDPRKLILSPYPNMPYKVSLTAWDHLQTCTGVNPQAISNFVGEFRDRGPEDVP